MKRPIFLCALFILAALATLTRTSPAQPADTLLNGDFESPPNAQPGAAPDHWMVTTPGTTLSLISENPRQGKQSLRLVHDPKNNPTAIILQQVSAAKFRGHSARFSGQLKTEGADTKSHLWMRVDRKGDKQGFFDNMTDRPVTKSEWTNCVIEGNVADDAEGIVVGLLIFGAGPVLADDLKLEDLGPAVVADVASKPLSQPNGLENLVALTKLAGVIRHFHASDEAAKANWDQFTIAAVERVEDANTPADLAATLSELFAPLAPTVRIAVGKPASPPPPLTAPAGATRWTTWKHNGFGQQSGSGGGGVYHSKRVKTAITESPDAQTPPGTQVLLDLGRDVWATVPIGSFADEDGVTLPRPTTTPTRPNRPDHWKPSGNDRSTRLADVILAWNVLQHFSPYIKNAKDWNQTLRDSLLRAATDTDDVAFQETLERLGSNLNDGHTWIGGPAFSRFAIPLDCEWVGDLLVVSHVPDAEKAPGILRGDVITDIDGTPTAQLYAAAAERISSATPQWKRYIARGRLLSRKTNDEAVLSIRRVTGELASVRVRPIPVSRESHDGRGRPADGSEVAPGVRYFDLCNKAEEVLKKHLPELAKSSAVIFDLRGYPNSAGSALAGYLSDEPVKCAFWEIPVLTLPNQQEITFDEARWDVQPAEPHIGGKIYFLTDGSAISYAETCMGMYEAYKLGEIVGGPTAGTNGNVNSIQLPGGYSLSFTGMLVLKHDHSPHHGIGIHPTIPQERTIEGIAAGKDEVLERAIQEATRK